jgi:hypothetical protein
VEYPLGQEPTLGSATAVMSVVALLPVEELARQ